MELSIRLVVMVVVILIIAVISIVLITGWGSTSGSSIDGAIKWLGSLFGFKQSDSQSQSQSPAPSQSTKPLYAPQAPAGSEVPQPSDTTTPEIEDLTPVTTDVFVDLHTNTKTISERYPSAVIDDYGRVSQQSLSAVTSLSPESSVLWYWDPWECRVVAPSKGDEDKPIEVFLTASDPLNPANPPKIDKLIIDPTVTCPIETIKGKDSIVCDITSGSQGLGSRIINGGLTIRCGAVIDGVEYFSKPKKVAKVAYFLLGDYKEINLLSEFDFFLKRTFLEKGDFKIIDWKGKCMLPSGIDPNICIDPNDIFDCAFPVSQVSAGRKEKIGKGVVIYFVPASGRAHCHPDWHFFQIYTVNYQQTTLAHELGHSYGFRDEYDYKVFVERDHGFASTYPSCCFDTPLSDSPYKQVIEGLEDQDLGSILNGTARIDNCTASGGMCSSSCRRTFVFNSSDCSSSGQMCCLPAEKLGNNCYPLAYRNRTVSDVKSTYKAGQQNICAGMPLDITGNPVPQDIDAPYRSIMGASLALTHIGFNKENLIYPVPKEDVGLYRIWPLKPGSPDLRR